MLLQKTWACSSRGSSSCGYGARRPTKLQTVVPACATTIITRFACNAANQHPTDSQTGAAQQQQINNTCAPGPRSRPQPTGFDATPSETIVSALARHARLLVLGPSRSLAAEKQRGRRKDSQPTISTQHTRTAAAACTHHSAEQ
jgi:hypothetical protein